MADSQQPGTVASDVPPTEASHVDPSLEELTADAQQQPAARVSDPEPAAVDEAADEKKEAEDPLASPTVAEQQAPAAEGSMTSAAAAPVAEKTEKKAAAAVPLVQGRSTRSRTRAAQYGISPAVGSTEFDSSLTSALLSLSTPYVSGGPSRPNYNEDAALAEAFGDNDDDGGAGVDEVPYRYQKGDDDPMSCVERNPSRVACVYRGTAPLTVKDFRNPAGGLFVRCKWCRARTSASSRATKARKEGLTPEFPQAIIKDPNVIPPTIGGMSTEGWEPVCSIKGCKSDHPLTINDFLNSYGDRLYRMCTTCRTDAARSRERNKKRKSGTLEDADLPGGGVKLDPLTTPVPECSGKGCASEHPLTLDDFLNPYGDALLKMCRACRARHSSYKKAKKDGTLPEGAKAPGRKSTAKKKKQPVAGEGEGFGTEEEVAQVLTGFAAASGSASDGSEKGKKKRKSKKDKSAAAAVKPDPSSAYAADYPQVPPPLSADSSLPNAYAHAFSTFNPLDEHAGGSLGFGVGGGGAHAEGVFDPAQFGHHDEHHELHHHAQDGAFDEHIDPSLQIDPSLMAATMDGSGAAGLSA